MTLPLICIRIYNVKHTQLKLEILSEIRNPFLIGEQATLQLFRLVDGVAHTASFKYKYDLTGEYAA